MPILQTYGENCESISPPGLRLKREGVDVIRKKILVPDRIRKIKGSFGFIPHLFLTDGFLVALNQHELLLYMFLVLAADRYGLSFYSCSSICSLLGLDLDQYRKAKDGLIKKDLLAFDGTIYQLLSLPTPLNAYQRQRPRSARQKGLMPIAQVFQRSLRGSTHDR